jgi:MobA/VirD2-like, nuclease domain
MIVKSLSRKHASYKGLLSYMFSEEKQKSHSPIERFVFTNNVSVHSASIEELTLKYMQNETLRQHPRENSVKMYHEILSFHKKSSPEIKSVEVLKDLVERYVDMRARDSLCVAVPHYNGKGGNYHIHLMISGTKLNGLASRISKGSYNHIRRELQNYQQARYPSLNESVVQFGRNDRARITDSEHQVIKRTGKSVKSELRGKLSEIIGISANMEELASHLKTEGIQAYDRNGELTGVYSDGGKKYRMSSLVNEDSLERVKGNSLREAHLMEEQTRSFELLRRKNHRDSISLQNDMKENPQEYQLRRER